LARISVSPPKSAGSNLFWARLKNLEWTNAALAERLGLTPTAIGNWKTNGVPAYATAYVTLYWSVTKALGGVRSL
jgi:hypothetical protein